RPAHGFVTPVGWSPDARTLLVAHEESSANQDVYAVDVASGAKSCLTRHQGEARYEQPRWSADGRSVWCVSTHGGLDRAALVRLELNQARTGVQKVHIVVEPKDGEVEEVAPSARARWLAWSVNAGGRSFVYLRDLKSN